MLSQIILYYFDSINSDNIVLYFGGILPFNRTIICVIIIIQPSYLDL